MQVVVSGSFDNLRTPHVRFLHEASRLGPVHLLLWSDEVVRAVEGKEPKFPQEERLYFLGAVRYVDRVTLVETLDADAQGRPTPDTLPANLPSGSPTVWAVTEAGETPDSDTPGKREFCSQAGLAYRVFRDSDLEGLPAVVPTPDPSKKKVIVTGCYDWLHSGHVRFFEETSELGDLYVAVGNDVNVAHLKGEHHPMFGQDERRYMVASIRYVTEALITSGMGWMDAAPDIDRLKPDIYAVNEDGDRPEKRAFCVEHGLQYAVLRRTPAEGLTQRSSTDLRGF
jgi:cytidyltransferase-like protein